MKLLTLQMPEKLLQVTLRCAKSLHISRATYIRYAIECMNRQTVAQLRADRLVKASKKVRKESMRVNREFAAIEMPHEVVVGLEALDKRKI